MVKSTSSSSGRESARFTSHAIKRCLERGVDLADVLNIIACPFATGASVEHGRLWLARSVLCGVPRAWRWLKVIAVPDDEGGLDVLTVFPLERRPLQSAGASARTAA